MPSLQENNAQVEHFANKQISKQLNSPGLLGNSERPYTSGDADEVTRFLHPALYIETSMSDHAVQEKNGELGSLKFSNRLVWSKKQYLDSMKRLSNIVSDGDR
jgi:hypothetical protein